MLGARINSRQISENHLIKNDQIGLIDHFILNDM